MIHFLLFCCCFHFFNTKIYFFYFSILENELENENTKLVLTTEMFLRGFLKKEYFIFVYMVKGNKCLFMENDGIKLILNKQQISTI